jgi:hypothetical protein
MLHKCRFPIQHFEGHRNSGSSTYLRLRRPTPDQAGDQEYNKNNQKDKEQDFGYSGGSRRYPGEPKNRSYDCNNKKNHCPVKHVVASF